MDIIAFDPGGTTGWRSLECYNHGPGNMPVWHGGVIGPHRHHVELWGLLETMKPELVICEHFVPQERKNAMAVELISRNYEGVIELWCAMHQVKLHFQNASEGKGLFTEDKISKCGLWKPSRHERDATAHLLHYITNDLLDYRWIRMTKTG